MRYFLIMSSFLLFCGGADAQIVRTQKQPDFFVPEAAMSHGEKLPPAKFRTRESSSETISHISADTPIRKQTARVPQTAKKEKKKKENPKELSGTPEYQKKYDIYHSDVETLKKTGNLPNRPDLNNDLGKMRTNEALIIVE